MKKSDILSLSIYVQYCSDWHAFVSEIEVVSVTSVIQLFVVINEKHGIFDCMFLVWFGKERASDSLHSGRLEPCMQVSIRVRIDCYAQPTLLVIKSDHDLINRGVIRVLTRFWL